MKRLLIVGDSIAKGVVFSRETNKYSLVHLDRFARLREMGVDVKNVSQMGATVEKGLRVLDRPTLFEDGGAKTEVLLEFGGNDSDYNWKAISQNPDSPEHTPNVLLERFAGLYRECIEKAREKGASVCVSNLLPISAQKYFSHITKGLCAQNILRWLGSEEMLYRWHEYYNAMVERVAMQSGCRLLNVRAPFLLRHDYESLLCQDGIHPNEQGYRALDAVLFEQLRPLFA